MRKTALAAFATATLLLAAQTEADVIRRGFNVSEGGTLTLTGAIGDITVVTGGTGVAVEITRDVRRSSRSDESVLADHKVVFDQSGNDVRIEVDHDSPRRWFGSDNLRVKTNIRVPSRYNVSLATSGGSIDVTNLTGTIECRTSGGNIEVGRITGALLARTSGGDVTAAGVSGSVDIRTSGGDIEIGDVTGKVDARTSGGNITTGKLAQGAYLRSSGGGIEISESLDAIDAVTSGGSIRARLTTQPKGDSRLSTSGGNVVVEISAASRVSIDAHASGGEVESDVPVTVIGRQREGALTGDVNGGGPKLVLRTSGGSVRLRKG